VDDVEYELYSMGKNTGIIMKGKLGEWPGDIKRHADAILRDQAVAGEKDGEKDEAEKDGEKEEAEKDGEKEEAEKDGEKEENVVVVEEEETKVVDTEVLDSLAHNLEQILNIFHLREPEVEGICPERQ
jgi:hypothetical protein